MPGNKSEQRLFIAERDGFYAGVGGNAFQIETCCGLEQIAAGTLGNVSEGEVQAGDGISPLEFCEFDPGGVCVRAEQDGCPMFALAHAG